MTRSFQEASAIAGADGAFRADVPDGWQQGRGAFGGLVLAMLARAMERCEVEPARRLRSLSGELCAPVLPGHADITVATLRRGRGVTFLESRLLQEGGVAARASAAFAVPRGSPVAFRGGRPPPDAPPWRDVPLVPIAPPLGPVFAAHYEYRSSGPLPFTGAALPITAGWVREHEPAAGAHLDAAAVVALLDAWWPALFSIDDTPRPIATIAFTMELVADPTAIPADEPLLFAGRVESLHEGFFAETRELWRRTPEGTTLVGLNHQTFAILA
jgi:hypothetical protein